MISCCWPFLWARDVRKTPKAQPLFPSFSLCLLAVEKKGERAVEPAQLCLSGSFSHHFSPRGPLPSWEDCWEAAGRHEQVSFDRLSYPGQERRICVSRAFLKTATSPSAPLSFHSERCKRVCWLCSIYLVKIRKH